LYVRQHADDGKPAPVDYSYDDSSRLTEDSLYFYTYDANGNLTRKTAKRDGLTSVYDYDPLDRLIAARPALP